MAGVDLAAYDGSAGYLVDSNVWIDCVDPSSQWHDWAIDQLQACSERAPLHVNLVIYTELLVPEPDVAALDAMLDVFETQRSPLPWACATLAAKAVACTASAVACVVLDCPIFSSAPTPQWPISRYLPAI